MVTEYLLSMCTVLGSVFSVTKEGGGRGGGRGGAGAAADAECIKTTPLYSSCKEIHLSLGACI